MSKKRQHIPCNREKEKSDIARYIKDQEASHIKTKGEQGENIRREHPGPIPDIELEEKKEDTAERQKITAQEIFK